MDDPEPAAPQQARAALECAKPGRTRVLVYCCNPACHHKAEIDASNFPDDVTFGDLQPRMLCTVCNHRRPVVALWLMPWSCPFEDPITLPDGRTLSTLRDAASYLMALPGKTRQSDEWQAAIEALLMAAENRGPLMHARIGMLRALNRNVKRVFESSRKDTRWGKRKLERDEQPIALHDSRSTAGAFWLGRLSDTGQAGKPILAPGRWQGLGASRNETGALRLSPWSDPTTSTGSKSRSPLKP